MTDDLVKRLRDYGDLICEEAAAEIERLRKMQPIANVTLSGDGEYWKDRAERAENAESERNEWEKTATNLLSRAESAEAERDALRHDAECWRQFKRDCEDAKIALKDIVGKELADIDAARGKR